MLLKETIKQNQTEYTIEIDLTSSVSDAINGNCVYKITATAKDLETREKQEVVLRVEVHIKDEKIHIIEDKDNIEIVVLSLNCNLSGEYPDGSDVDPKVEETEIFSAGELVSGYKKAIKSELEDDIKVHTVEFVIQAIPTDPFLGCIIKSATSTLVGQVIRCWEGKGQDIIYKSLVDRGRNIPECVGKHARRLGLVFMYRIGRCFFSIGAS